MKRTPAKPCLTDGFSLVEMAIVLAIVGLLLDRLIPAISSQIEQQRTNETRKTLEEIQQALTGFAIANGRLPCPASSSNGEESFAAGGDASNGICSIFFNGFVPAVTLGISPVNDQGYALDGWNNGIRYAVASNTVSGVTNTFTRTDGMKNATMDKIANADLMYICASATGITASDCGTASNKLTGTTPAIVYSTGRNGGYGGTGIDELANPNRNSLNNDRVFISHMPTPSAAANGEFDDIVIWLSPNTLFNRMVTAGKLP